MQDSDNNKLLTILDMNYNHIRAIEVEHSIFGKEGDFRPRIEHYHDAIRAFTANDHDISSKYSRLSPEHIAYDSAILRQIIDKPSSAGRGDQHFATSSDIAQASKNQTRRARISIDVRKELSDLYKSYLLIYVAILAPRTDDNYTAREEEANDLQNELAELGEMLKGLEEGSVSIHDVSNLISNLENDNLYELMSNLLNSGQISKKNAKKIMARLESLSQQVSNEMDSLNQASNNLATSKLAVYENSKDLVKGLMGKGINIAGKFTANAISQSQGKGQGLGI